MDFSEKLKALRKKHGHTQSTLAHLLNVSQNAIYNWENGKREPNLDTILKIADMVYDKLKYREEQEMIQTNDEAMIKNPYFIEVSLRDGNSPFRTLIQVVLHWNINHRRQRYYRRQKVFSNR